MFIYGFFMIFSSIFKVNINMIEGPRTVLMNDCPKQNDQRKVSKKTIFYHENDSRFYPQVIRKRNFLIGHVSIKKYGLKTLFCYLTHRNSKSFTKVLPPPPVTKLILLHTVAVLHFTHHINMA